MNQVLQRITPYSPQAVYQQTSVETSSPEKLIVLLYSKAILLLNQAKKALEDKKYEESHNCILRVQNIICELNRTLDMEKGGEIAQNLRGLYMFFYGETVKANIKKDTAFLQPVIDFFESLREAWLEIAKTARTGEK